MEPKIKNKNHNGNILFTATIFDRKKQQARYSIANTWFLNSLSACSICQ